MDRSHFVELRDDAVRSRTRIAVAQARRHTIASTDSERYVLVLRLLDKSKARLVRVWRRIVTSCAVRHLESSFQRYFSSVLPHTRFQVIAAWARNLISVHVNSRSVHATVNLVRSAKARTALLGIVKRRA